MVSKLVKALSILLVSVIIAVGVGCGGGDGKWKTGDGNGETTTFDANEVVDNTLQAQDDIESFRLDMDMSVDIHVVGGAAGEGGDVTMSVDASGAVDQADREMELGMRLDVKVTGEEDMRVDVDVYLVDDYLYLKGDMPGEEPMWVKLEVPEEGAVRDLLGDPQAILDLMSDIIEAVELESKGYETVKGIDCYVIEVKPDLDQLLQILMQLPGLEELTGEIPDLSNILEDINLEDLITELSFKEWIAKDTYFLTKVEAQIAVHVTAEDLGMVGEEGELSGSLSFSLVTYDHNKPVSIELPAEAEDAEEIFLPW